MIPIAMFDIFENDEGIGPEMYIPQDNDR